MIIVIIYINYRAVELQISKKNHVDTIQITDSSESVRKNTPVTASKNISSAQLFGGARELVIEHAGAAYRLRLTNQGKLILTK